MQVADKVQVQELFRVLNQYKTKRYQIALRKLMAFHTKLEKDTLTKEDYYEAISTIQAFRTFTPRQYRQNIQKLADLLVFDFNAYKDGMEDGTNKEETYEKHDFSDRGRQEDSAVVEVKQEQLQIQEDTKAEEREEEKSTAISEALKRALEIKESEPERVATPTEQLAEKIMSMKDIYLSIKQDFKLASDTVAVCDKESGDLLHAFELLDLDIEQEHEYVEKLVESRRTRRQAKNFMEQAKPIIDCFTGIRLLDKMNAVTSTAKNLEKTQNVRIYTPRVMTELKPVFEKSGNTKSTGSTNRNFVMSQK